MNGVLKIQGLPKVWILAVILTVLAIGCEKSPDEELVHIPDKAFLDGLIAGGVDTNGDGQISFAEAEATQSIVLPPSGISDLTGLDAFIKLDSFSITLNPLSGLDLSANTGLKYAECTYCELANLDVSENLLLEVFICSRNQIEELDVSQNLSLHTLVCKNNLLTSLDLSVNVDLVKMISCGNELSILDISNNTKLELIGFDNMPMLTEVCVWTLPFPPPGVTTLQGFSPNVVFTDQCRGF